MVEVAEEDLEEEVDVEVSAAEAEEVDVEVLAVEAEEVEEAEEVDVEVDVSGLIKRVYVRSARQPSYGCIRSRGCRQPMNAHTRIAKLLD